MSGWAILDASQNVTETDPPSIWGIEVHMPLGKQTGICRLTTALELIGNGP